MEVRTFSPPLQDAFFLLFSPPQSVEKREALHTMKRGGRSVCLSQRIVLSCREEMNRR
jgi:hypothetical protein